MFGKPMMPKDVFKVLTIEKSMEDWIEVEDQLPPEGKALLLYGIEYLYAVIAQKEEPVGMCLGKWSAQHGFTGGLSKVTHWRLRPEEPKAEKKKCKRN